MLKIEPLSGIAGARVADLDLSQALDAEVFSQIEKALHDHCFLVFPGQTLSSHQFVAFSRYWAPPNRMSSTPFTTPTMPTS